MFIYAVARALWSFGIKAVELVKELAAKDALFCEGVIEVFEWLVNKGKEKYDVNKLLSSMKPEDIIALQKEQNADFEANENYKYFNKFIEALYADLCRVTGKKLKKLSNKKLTETVLAVFGTLEADDVASFDSVALLVDSGKEKKDAVKSVLKIIENYRSALSKSFYSSLNPKEQAGVNAQATVTADMVVDKLLDHPFLKGFFSRTSDNKLVIKSCSNCGSIDSETVNNEDGSVSYICKSCGHPVEVDTSDFSSKEFFDELKSVSADLKSALKKLDDLASVIVCVYDAVKSTPEAVVAILEKRGLLKTSEDTLNHWYAEILLFNSHVKHRRYGKIDKKRADEQDKFVTAILEANLGETEEVMKKIVEPWQTASKKYERYLKRRAAGDKIMAPFKRLWAKVKEHPLISFVTVITIFAVIAAIFSPATLIDPETGIAMDASYHDKTKEMAAVEAVAETYALDSIAKTHGISDISQIDTRAFDITLDGGASQPESVITISIPLTEYELTAKENVRVFHQGSTSAEYIESRIVGDKVEFKTDHLSVYIVAVVPYKVEFVSGDEVIYEKAKLHGNHIDVPAAELTGHSFICWQATKADGSTVELTPDTKRAYITENVKFTAHYAPESYTLNISSDGISTAGSVILTYGEEYTLPESLLAKTGYTVRKLSIAGVPISSSGVWNIDVDTVPEIQRYIYAPMSANEYKVLFDLNIPNSSGASYNDTVESLECFYDGEYALPKSPIDIDGWKQIGWGLSSGGSDTVYTVGSKIKNLTAKDGGEVVLYAKWAQNNYTIHFDSNKPTGASSEITGTMADMMLTYDADARPLTANAFGLTGWTFAGWSTSRDGAVVYSDSASVKNLATDGSITLFAKWQANSYTVNFIGNKPERASHGVEGSMANLPLIYDDTSVTKIPEYGFSLLGFTPLGFSTTPDGEVAYRAGDALRNITAENGGKVNLYLQWSENTYTVAYNSNKPENTESVPEGYMISDSFFYENKVTLKPCAYSLLGYKFGGWSLLKNDDADFADGASGLDALTPENGATVTLYAVWTPITYTVHFDANKPEGAMSELKGSTASITLTYDKEQPLNANGFVLPGYKFNAWYTNPECFGISYANEEAVKNLTHVDGSEITLYADWDECGYTVKFVKNTPADASNPVTGSMPELGLNIARSYDLPACEYQLVGWQFNSWNTSSDGSGTRFADEDTVVSGTYEEGDTVTLYAQWEKNPYTVKFNANKPQGASGSVQGSIADIPLLYDGEVGIVPAIDFTLEGWQPIGFATDPNATTPTYKSGNALRNLTDVRDGTVMLYTVWEAKTYSVKLLPNKPANASSEVTGQITPNPISVEYDKTVNLPTDYRLTGWIFIGYSKAPDGAVDFPVDASGNVAANNITTGSSITLYARWLQNSYTVIFNANRPAKASHDVGGEMPNIDALYDGEAFEINNGYSLVGWTLLGFARTPDGEVEFIDGKSYVNLTVEDNITINLYAIWRQNEYIAAFPAPIGDIPLRYDDDPVSIPSYEVTRTGFTFDGFSITSGADSSDVIYLSGGEIKNLTAIDGARVAVTDNWIANTYYIMFNSAKPTNASNTVSGSMPVIAATYGESFCLPSNGFALAGWIYKGWSTSPYESVDYTDSQEIVNLVPNGIITLYAVWEPIKYTVVYGGGNGTPYTVYNNYYDTPVTIPSNTGAYAEGHTLASYTRNGMNFRIGGVYKNLLALQDIEAYDGNTITIALSPVWSQNSYVISIDLAGGSGNVTSMRFLYGETTVSPVVPQKPGYDFAGWEYSDSSFGFGDSMPAKNITATAIWTYKTVYYDSGDGYENYKIVHDDNKEKVLDYMDISSLSPFFSEDYYIVFEIEMCMREVDTGYQQIYLINEGTGVERGYIELTYGGSPACKEWGIEKFTIVVNGSVCSDVMRLKFGAYGNSNDTWYRRWVHANISVIAR